MKVRSFLMLILLCVMVVCAVACMSMHCKMHDKMCCAKIKDKACCKQDIALRSTMRKLWEEHIVYTRDYITSALASLEDIDAIYNRLLKNQDDIGDVIKPYYGDDAGKKLASLLRGHIMIATEVVKAAKMDSSDNLDVANKKWSANADAIAEFLSSANPNWPKKDLMDMLYTHLALTTGEVKSRLKKDWVADIDYYDRGHAHMLMFADMLSEGIEKQFQEKCKR